MVKSINRHFRKVWCSISHVLELNLEQNIRLSLNLFVPLSVADPGFPEEGANLRGGANLLFSLIFAENWITFLKIGMGHERSLAPLNPPLFTIHVSSFGVVLFQSAMTAVKMKSPRLRLVSGSVHHVPVH